MLRTPVAALTAALLLTAFSNPAAKAADPHWFYDNTAAPSYNEYYSEYHRRSWQNGPLNDPRYSVYQRDPEHRYRRPRHRDDYGNGYYNGRLSCLQAVEDLKDAGFRYIEVVTCRNGSYVYDAVRGREPWRIQVSRASGEIINVEPLGD